MKAEEFIDGYLEKFKKDTADDISWQNYENSSILISVKQMYDALGDEKYFTLISESMQRLITKNGELEKEYAGKFDINAAGCGKLMFFMYDKTGDEKYRNAIECIMNLLRGDEDKLSPGDITMEELYMIEPFYMEYETRYDKKAKYSDIIKQFENADSRLDKENKNIDQIGLYLTALIDALSGMSFEIYEKYRALQDLFRRTLANLLKNSDNGTISYSMESAGNVGNAMIAYAVIKACRMGIILKEKYAPAGMEIVQKLIEDEKRLEDIFNDKRAIAPFISAYGQYAQLKSET